MIGQLSQDQAKDIAKDIYNYAENKTSYLTSFFSGSKLLEGMTYTEAVKLNYNGITDRDKKFDAAVKIINTLK
jgi:hypothetical protein